jgi:hypothetical protein
MTSALEGGEWSAARPGPYFTPGKDPVPIVQEAGWAPGPVWTGPENLTPTGIRSPDRPARSQSLYRLSYPAHIFIYYCSLNTTAMSHLKKKVATGKNDVRVVVFMCLVFPGAMETVLAS